MFKKIVLFILFFALTFASVCAISLDDETMHTKTEISLNGEQNVLIDVFSEYVELGAVANHGSDILGYDAIEYQTLGAIDTNVIGEYKIEYKTEGESPVYATRTVKVVDRQAPVIDAPDEINVYIGTTIFNVAYSATDNYDGDLTANVIKTDNADSVALKVTDSSGNAAEKIIRVNFCEDVTAPIIQLNGFPEMCVKIGGEYVEPGYTATDNADGDLTASVTVSGTVDTTKVGFYDIVYTVADKTKNTASIKRSVYVYETEQAPAGTNPTGSVIYLTFDDGPGKYTEQLLRILKKRGVNATFFVTNQFPKYQNLIGVAHKLGHSIGVHTYSHQWSIYANKDAYFDDFSKMNQIIEAQTGQKSKIFRFPGGTNNKVSENYNKGIMSLLRKEMPNAGYLGYDWTLNSLDTELNSASRVASHVKKLLKPGQANIILMHDIKQHSVNAVEEIIRYGLSKGYVFATINENTPTHYFIPIN